MEMESASVLSCDLETTGVDPITNEILSIGFGVQTVDGDYLGIIFVREVLEELKVLLLDFIREAPGTMCFHNIKFDVSFLRQWAGDDRYRPRHPIDTMLMGYVGDERGLSNEGSGMAYFTAGLKDHARLRYDIPDYHYPFDEFLALPEDCRPWEEMYVYQAMDVVTTLRLYYDLRRSLDEESEKLVGLVENLLTPASLAFSSIELRGFPIDRGYLEDLERTVSIELANIVFDLKKKAKEVLGDETFEFNPGSSKQVRRVAEAWKFTPPSFEKEALQVELDLGKWPEDCKEFFRQLLVFRQKDKVRGTYIRGLLDRADDDGRVRPDFQLHGTDTGRLSCRNPNFQNIPTIMGPMIKKAFIAPPGWKLINADFSQLELRVAAWYSRDENMLRAFRDGLDIHRWVASLMFKKPPEEITSFERYLAKYLDFGLLYGRSARGLLDGMEAAYIVKMTGKPMTIQEADALQKAFFDGFPGLVTFIEAQHRVVRRDQFVETPMGRRRRFPYIDRSNIGSVERRAVNTVIQSLASDMTLTSIVRLDRTLDPSRAYVVSTVHDSIMLLSLDECLGETIEQVRRTMETPCIPEFDVPLRVDIGWGQHWGEAKD